MKSQTFHTHAHTHTHTHTQVDKRQELVTVGTYGYTPLFQRQVGDDPLLIEASDKGASFATMLLADRADDGFNATLPEFKGMSLIMCACMLAFRLTEEGKGDGICLSFIIYTHISHTHHTQTHNSTNTHANRRHGDWQVAPYPSRI